MANDEEEGRLRGPGVKRANMRRWYFSHRHNAALQDLHHREAERARREAEARRHSPDTRRRNEAKRLDYEADLREWEERRLLREDAKAQWRALKADLSFTGVRASDITEDYRDFPVELRKKDGIPIDEAAAHLGFSYPDDFVAYIAGAKHFADEAARVTPKRPKRPIYERESSLYGRAFLLSTKPELRARYTEINELRGLVRKAEKELGRDDPAVDDLRDALDEARHEYEAAARS